MQVKSLDDLLTFLNYLRGRGIKFTLSQPRDDSIMVAFTIVGARVEAEFLPDHVEYSYFSGDESVHNDFDELVRFINERWD